MLISKIRGRLIQLDRELSNEMRDASERSYTRTRLNAPEYSDSNFASPEVEWDTPTLIKALPCLINVKASKMWVIYRGNEEVSNDLIYRSVRL